ncbi:MAG: pyridoxal-phosphate dependent enzyme, partial [Anaerolineaceae bacterium]|nr:pyridoxal-phosphate dependent enzyme [Anaerolineaceae bacterium]
MAIVGFIETKARLLRENSLTGLIGNTPLLPLRHLGGDLPPGVQLLAKAEWFNPSGSVKDRPALNIFREALAEG